MTPLSRLFQFGLAQLENEQTLTQTGVCYYVHQWPVFMLFSGVGIYAHAAFFVLRAHAARIRRFCSGLLPAVRRSLLEGPQWAVSCRDGRQGPSFCCTTHIPTLRAETGPSLRFASRSAMRTTRSDQIRSIRPIEDG